MEESEDNLSSEDIKYEDSISNVKVKPKKRSLVERELETNLTARVTSPIQTANRDAASTSRYGRARRIKIDSDSTETISRPVKSPKLPKSPNKVQSPAYKMHASNSPIRVETPKQIEYSLDNQIETIYNENISLSRFGSEEKKCLSTSKYPKVYIRKDLIQTKDKDPDDTVVLIKNMFSPSNSGKKSNNFNLENSSEKYNMNTSKQSLNGYAKTASVVKTLDFDGNKKKKNVERKVVLSKNELFELEAKCEYQVGDLAWARMGTYPFWPCIITRDPLSGMYVKKKLFGRIERDVLHVTFFGDNGRRGWIVDSMLRKFLGQLEFETARVNFTPEAKKKDPRLYAAYFISDKKLSQWQISVEEAEMLLREPKRLRIEILNDLLEKSRSLKTTPKQEKSKKVTRTNSDVSLSESLYDTLFSEQDFTTKDSERSRSKSRNRSLDVSEVVTACLDNMAAKTGITKIQRQSHMDRWLQKAKSKTPEKSQMKSQVKVDNKSAKSKTKQKPKESKRTYNFRSSSQESVEDNKLQSHQDEHDYSQKSKDRNSPVILDDVESEYENADIILSDSVESGSGLGIISKVETLCSKDQFNDEEDMILTVVNDEIYISEAGNIGDEICIQLNQIEDIQTHNNLEASNIESAIGLENCDTVISIDTNNDLMETDDQNNENISKINENLNQIKNNLARDNKTCEELDENVNNECMDVSELHTNMINNEDQLENNDLNVENSENVAFNDHEAMNSTKMSVDEFMDVDNQNEDCEKDKCVSVAETFEQIEKECNLDSTSLIINDGTLETVVNATNLSNSHDIIAENNEINHDKISTQVVEMQTTEINISQTMEENLPQTKIEDVPPSIEDHIPRTTKENVSQPIEEEISQTIEENVLHTIHENIPQIIEENVPDTIKDIPQTIEDIVPQIIGENVPDTIEDIPQTIEDIVPQIIEENVPQTVEENVLQIIEDNIPQTVNVPQIAEESTLQIIEKNVSRPLGDVLETLKENVSQSTDEIVLQTTEENIPKTVEETNTPVDNHFFELGTIESHAKKKKDASIANVSPSNRNSSKALHKFKLSLNKYLEKDNYGTENVGTTVIGCDSPKDCCIEKEPLKLNGYCINKMTSKRINDVGSVISSDYAKQIEISCEKDSIIHNTLYLDKEINRDIVDEDEDIFCDEEIVGKKLAEKEKEINDSVKPIEQVSENETALINGCTELVHIIPSIVTNETVNISLDEPVMLNGYHDDNDADTNSIGDNDEPLAAYQLRLKAKQSEGNAKMFDLEKPELLSEDIDNLSVKSGDSEMSVGRRKRKLIEKKNILEDPEFLKYLEIRQDALMDENPELTGEEITNYLYKTWLYEEGLKTDAKKADDIDQSNLVKGLNVDPVPVKKIRKKIKTEKDKDTNLEKEPIPKEKSKRRIIRPYYKEDFSDMDDDIEYYEIFKPKQKVSKVLEPHIKDEREGVIKEENFQDEIGIEMPIEVNEEFVSEEIDQVEEYFRQLTEPKPNLFKGLIREKVCEICEKYGNLVKCKGCYSMFHVDCVKKQVEIVEISIPMRGRKKKKKNRGRKAKEDCLDSGSQSDEKSQDANVSEEMHNMSLDNEEDYHITANEDEFESKLSAKMKELLENPESIECDSDSNDEHDFTDVNIGECKIVDVKQRKKEQNDYSDFKCNNCQKYDIPICFVCKSSISPKDKAEHRQKCQVAHCHKYYHMECLDHWPQTQFNGGELSRTNKGNEYFEALSCPRHVCHTCVCDDPRGCKTRFSGDKLARCVRCPATYHTFTKCLPAGSQILSGSHIICPRHYEHRPGKVPCHVNTGWCFICALGGSLICCEYCPTSFHAECLNIKPPEGGYMCEDCETGRLPLYGEMVWVKLGHYRWWPGIVLHPSEIPQNILAVKHSPGEFVVRFFGQYDHYWVNRGRVFPFQEGDSGKVSSQKSKIDAAFTMAMEHAQRACEILKTAQPNEEESLDIASSLLPPHYVKLKVNKPCGALCGRRVDLEEGSLTQCECDPHDGDPCGPYTQCLNRMLLTECGPTCRAGDRCNNRAFEKRLYPKMTPYRTPHRGWGLKTLVDIKAGQFVIEYVGELIDEDEFQRRMKRKHEVRDENFYFLTLDKERVIDAGPKGNFARFMNHSCEPNCETQKWTVLGDIRVGLFALYDIPANSELTFNYNLESAGIEKKRCMCGAKRCSGYIGAKPKQDDQPKKNKLQTKRTYKKRKNLDDSPSTSQKPKNRIGRPYKPRELTDIEKDLLIIKNATNAMSSDSECSGRLSSLDSTKDNKNLKRKKIFEDISPKRIKMDSECV